MRNQAKELLDYAFQFFDAYRHVPRPQYPMYDWPRYFLLCHCIELTLKAYLSKHGIDKTELSRKYGHNLSKLFDGAIAHGLTTSERIDKIPQYLTEAHSDHWARYPMDEESAGKSGQPGKPVVMIEYFAPGVRDLLGQVSKCILGYDALLPPSER
jgi:hypothetical protein